jgi:hypothetical protein
MDDIVGKLFDSLKDQGTLSFVISVVLILIFNHKKIFDLLDEIKKIRINKLKEALECDFLTGSTKSHLQEELINEYFRVSTGIRLEKQFREKLIKIHESTNGDLPFLIFKKALPHLNFKDGIITLNITIYDRVSYYFNLLFGVFFGLVGLIFVMFPSQFDVRDIYSILFIYGLGFTFMALFILMISQTKTLLSAKKIEKYLVNNS